MLNYLDPSGIVLQLSIVIGQILLAFVLLRHSAWRRWPYFFIFIAFNAWKSSSMVLLGFRNAALYDGIYWTGGLIADILAFFAAWDIYRRTFGPRIALPEWAPQRILTRLAVAVSSSVALAALLSPANGGMLNRALMTAESMLYGSLCAAFSVMIMYSMTLRITWRPWSANIAGGFVLFLIVNLVASFVRGSTHGTAPWIAARVGPFAYVLVLAWWNWRLWGQEPVPRKLTAKESEQLLRLHREMMEAARKLIA